MFTVVADLKEKFHGALNNQRGFTLVELLIVLAIMGALIAMVAPRLAGFTDRGDQRAHDTNMERLLTGITLAADTSAHGFPDGMTNLISITSGTITHPLFTVAPGTTLDPIHPVHEQLVLANDDRMDGKEAFVPEFVQNNHLRLHTLSVAEAEELRAAGLTVMYNLNFDGKGGFLELRPSNERVDVASGLQVMMVGGGAPNYTGAIVNALTAGTNINYPEMAHRIVVGVGDQNDLVKWGLFSKAAEDPRVVRDGMAGFVNYAVVLPRLNATELRHDADTMTVQRVTGVGSEGTTGGTLVDGTAISLGNVMPTELASRPGRVFTGYGLGTLAIIPPDGSKWPEDGERWQVTAVTTTP